MPEKKKKRKRINADRVLSVSAMVISVGTLVVIMRQTNLLGEQTDLIRREQHISVMPYLEVDVSSQSQDWMALRITNSGLGPARIDKSLVYKNDSVYQTDVSTFFLNNFNPQNNYELNYATEGTMIMAGAQFTLIGSKPSEDPMTRFINELTSQDIRFDIFYSSLYGDHWVWSSEQGRPEELEEYLERHKKATNEKNSN